MLYDDGSGYMGLDQAVALAVRYRFTEADAREYLIRAIENKRLKYRIDPPHPPEVVDVVRYRFGLERPSDWPARLELRREPIDWAASEASVFERYPVDHLTLAGLETPRRGRVTVHGDEWLALVKREREFAGPGQALQPAKPGGRKPKGKTCAVEILAEFDRLDVAGQVYFGHGGKIAIARMIQSKFPDYTDDQIYRIIRKTFEERARQQSGKRKIPKRIFP